MTYLLQQMLNGLQLGSIYALIALGYTMVYGILRMINFAHGDLFMVGAFALLVAASALGLPFVPSLWRVTCRANASVVTSTRPPTTRALTCASGRCRYRSPISRQLAS